MPRTTLDIDASVLREAKKIARSEGKSLGQVLSELATAAIAQRKRRRRQAPFRWAAQPMHARVDLEDKEAVRRILDAE